MSIMARHMLIGILMPILVFSILSYTCYHYIFTIQASSRLTAAGKPWYASINSVCALILCMHSLISYSIIMLTPAVKLPENQDTKLEELTDTFPFPKHHHAIESADTPIVSLSLSGEKGEPLYCEKCRTVKPERTHHCRECNRCAPKMDHHCIWINGCVDDSNYRHFFLFVFYVAVYACWVEVNAAPMLLKNIADQIGGSITLNFCWKAYKVYLASIYHLWKNVGSMVVNREWIPLLTGVEGLGLEGISFHWYSVTVLGFLFGLTLLGFTGVHLYYIIRNRTSIEHVASRPTYIRADFDKSGSNYEVIQIDPKTNLYDQGLYRNWCSVMGSNPFICLLPYASFHAAPKKNLFTKDYPYNTNFKSKIIQDAMLQRESRLRQDEAGNSYPCAKA